MASCFDNLIGLKGVCNYDTPTSGLTLDQIGLHKHEIEKYIEKPYNNVSDFYTDYLNISINEVTLKIFNHFAHKYRSQSIIKNGRIGLPQKNMQTNSSIAGYNGGLEVNVSNYDSPIEFYLSEFSLFIDLTTTVTVNVYDAFQNSVIDTFNIETTANKISTVYLNKTYKSNRKKMQLVFLYDISVADSYQVSASSNCATCSSINYTKMNSYVTTRGVKIPSSNSVIDQNLVGVGHTNGISLVYSINCAHAEWMCSAGNLIARPLLYCLSKNILTYGLNSSGRNNSKTIEDSKKLQARIDLAVFEFDQAMNNILNNMAVPNDKVCFYCNSRIKSVISL